MANRYWVGGTDTWDTTAGTKWAATSGGAGGASAPTTTDDVFLDANSGSGTITRSGAINIKSLDCTGFTGTLAAVAAGTTINTGDVKLVPGMTFSVTSANWTFTTSGTSQITTAGKSMPDLTVNGTGTVRLLDDWTSASNRDVTLTKGTLDLNGFTMQTDVFVSSNSNTRTLAFGSGTLYPTGGITCGTTTNMTVTGTSTGLIRVFAGTFTSGSGLSWPALWAPDAVAGISMTIDSASSFDKLLLPGGGLWIITLNQDVTFTNGMIVSSSSNNFIISVLKSNSGGTPRTVTCNVPPQLRNWTFTDITAAGATPFRATHACADNGGNTNILFDGSTSNMRLMGVGA